VHLSSAIVTPLVTVVLTLTISATDTSIITHTRAKIRKAAIVVLYGSRPWEGEGTRSSNPLAREPLAR